MAEDSGEADGGGDVWESSARGLDRQVGEEFALAELGQFQTIPSGFLLQLQCTNNRTR